jgi:penicillin G amidase
VFSSRFLKIINLSIAVLLVVVAGVVWWFAGRPLPQTSGTISAPLSAKATVAFDAIGVPHIEAASWEDAIFVQGFLTAQERMWQMDALRRLAAGELSEVVGKVALEVDQEARRLRLKRIAEMHERNLSNEDRAA